MVNIISRSAWGARSWKGQPYWTSLSARTHFLVHYWGPGNPRATSGPALAREVEAVHLNNGWSGVGYNFLVGQDGRALEGRGWDLVGAHCPGKNRTGFGVFVAVGGMTAPTAAAQRTVKELYAEANRRTGRTLTLGVHGDYYATECAGKVLSPWVHAGMPVTAGSTSSAEKAPAPAPVPVKKYTREDVARFQRVHNLDDDGLYGDLTNRQALAIRRTLKKGVKFNRFDLFRYYRLKFSRPKDSRTSDDMRRSIQWALGVTVDGDWGDLTDAAWFALRDQWYMK